MRITPLDVRKQEFGKGMRGFDCDEVRAFLNTLADEYETVLIDNKQIRERIMEQDDKITEYKTMERTLRDTLMTAERVMSETRENANREGDLIIQEAQMKAKGILEECRLRTEELRREIVGLRKEKETYLARFRGLAEAQINFIDTHESDFEDLDKRLVDIVDNVVTSTDAKPATTSRAAHAAAPSFPTAPTPAPAPAHPTANTPGNTPGNPVGIAAQFVGTEVAPSTPAAPVSSENDIWRDYNPGQAAEPMAAVAAPVVEAPSAENPAENPAENAGEIPGQTSVAASVTVPEETVAGSIADIVSESLAEADEENAEERSLEALNVDVISNGQAVQGDQVAEHREGPTEAVNI